MIQLHPIDCSSETNLTQSVNYQLDYRLQAGIGLPLLFSCSFKESTRGLIFLRVQGSQSSFPPNWQMFLRILLQSSFSRKRLSSSALSILSSVDSFFFMLSQRAALFLKEQIALSWRSLAQFSSTSISSQHWVRCSQLGLKFEWFIKTLQELAIIKELQLMQKEDSQTSHNQISGQLTNEKTNQPAKEPTRKKKPTELGLTPDYVQHLQAFFRAADPAQQFSKDPEQREERISFLKEKLAILNHKNAGLYAQALRTSLIQDYHKQVQPGLNLQAVIINSTRAYQSLTRTYRQLSVNPTIVSATYDQFRKLWICCNSTKGKHLSQQLLSIWRYVPYNLLQGYLYEFNLLKRYQSIKIDEMFSFIASGFFENKIQQHSEYYRLFKEGRVLTQAQLEKFQAFEYQQLIPRITKKDQLFSDYVIELLKKDEGIARKVFECADMRQYEKIVQLTGKDIKDHPKLVKHAKKKHYRDIVRRSKEWFVIQDKISFSSDFVEWFAAELAKSFSKQQQELSDSASDCSGRKINYSISTPETANAVIDSMLLRQGLVPKKEKLYIENPLYELDDYIPAQFLLSKLRIQEIILEEYLALQFFKASPKDIVFIDTQNQQFDTACKNLLSGEVIGFDSQFWATASKYEEGGVSLIQLSIRNICYLFDYRALRKCEAFNAFFIELMQNQGIIKVGHTISSDLQFLYRTFHHKIDIKSFIDLVPLVQRYYPQQIQKSLATMSEKFLGKKMCKYQQRGNWNRRPLKKTQLTYASIDALVCVAIFQQILKEKNIPLKDFLAFQNEDSKHSSNQKVQIKGKEKEEQKSSADFDYKKFEEYLKQPIFLVDNMLKKLCSTMRNCGIDSEFISIRDYDLAMSQSKKQRRIFITRDTKLLTKRYSNVPIYLLKEKSDSDVMFKEIVKAFNIDLSKYQTLSRCVKCNNPELIVISKEEANKEIHFMYEDNMINQFWRCSHCKQIYWEGGQFKKAKDKYDQLRK